MAAVPRPVAGTPHGGPGPDGPGRDDPGRDAAGATGAIRSAAGGPVRPGAGPDDGASGPDGVADDESTRQQRRLRAVALIMVAVVVLAALPLYFGIRAATRDPVFNSLDRLDVPGWAALESTDAVSGSRWCLIDCRFRERTMTSERGPEETAQVYTAALTDAGWLPWKVELCPSQPVDGQYTCWTRDELTLDLWVRPPACSEDLLAQRPTVEPPAGDAAEGDPAAEPPGSGADNCSGSVVSIKVRNAIDDDRMKPQPSLDPSLTGEDPDPVYTDDPLLDLDVEPS
ncbi:hypothetical protein O7608_22940 [Solwaraspora sp. WMMA2056]|uniref:hypothetical protein n=1 Tax=Solwaraspora sp. WMMA2056 TaxID=3015161 RepID=UPI00259BEB60|nr:hypothetical protein [Solwaraspora sp. WMMA2056]WJK44067.1 hypothetical protein O7608_22940 [Solwaraspora sp. WMMA2056]